ncbi:hypothetical protein Peur_001131 [Populus x canadensis]
MGWVGVGSSHVRTPNGSGWGRSPDLKGLGAGSMFGPKKAWVWVLPSSNPKWLGVGSMSGPKRVGGWVHIRTQRGLGPSQSGPKIVLGVGPSISKPKRIGVWVLPCSDPRGLGFRSFRGRTQECLGVGLGYASGPKTCGSGSLTQHKGVHVNRPAGLVRQPGLRVWPSARV